MSITDVDIGLHGTNKITKTEQYLIQWMILNSE